MESNEMLLLLHEQLLLTCYVLKESGTRDLRPCVPIKSDGKILHNKADE